MSDVLAKKHAIQAFMQETSVEVTPAGARAVKNFSTILKPKMTVYVTFLPGSDFRDTLETVCRLKNEGYCRIPHFAAILRFFVDFIKTRGPGGRSPPSEDDFPSSDQNPINSQLI